MIVTKENCCKIREVYSLFGKKWALVLFHNITDSPVSFNKLNIITNKKISPALMSKRLKEMISLGIIEKRIEDNKHLYYLTEIGADLKDIMFLIKKWGEKHSFDIPESCLSCRFMCLSEDSPKKPNLFK